MKYTLFLTTLALLSAGSAAAQVMLPIEPAPTPISYPWSYNSPPVGLAYTETLQVNVTNRPSAAATYTGLPTTTIITVPTAESCTGTISFTNAAGTTIGKPVPFTVTTGQIFSAPLPFATTGFSGIRGEVVASVQGTTTIPSTNPSTNLCSLSISLETFDTNTGVTHVFLPLPGTGTVLPEVLSGTFSTISPSGATSVLK
jgi:hypothetical protein